jgi:hypothetical protein
MTTEDVSVFTVESPDLEIMSLVINGDLVTGRRFKLSTVMKDGELKLVATASHLGAPPYRSRPDTGSLQGE